MGTFADHVRSAERKKARGDKRGFEPKTDEDLLVQFLTKNL
jgi:hypothetical protein